MAKGWRGLTPIPPSDPAAAAAALARARARREAPARRRRNRRAEGLTIPSQSGTRSSRRGAWRSAAGAPRLRRRPLIPVTAKAGGAVGRRGRATNRTACAAAADWPGSRRDGDVARAPIAKRRGRDFAAPIAVRPRSRREARGTQSSGGEARAEARCGGGERGSRRRHRAPVGAIADRAPLLKLRLGPLPRRPVGVKPPFGRLRRFAAVASR